MNIVLKWSASVVDAEGTGMAGAKTDLALFDTSSATWKVVQTQTADAAGKLAGSLTLSVTALPYAPAARLTQAGTASILSGEVQVSPGTDRGALNLDFGRVVWLSSKQRLAALGTMRIADTLNQTLTKGKIATTTTLDVNQIKADLNAEISKSYAADLAEKSRIIAERETALEARTREITERDVSIGNLRKQLDAQAAEIDRLRRPEVTPGTPGPAMPLPAVRLTDFAAGLGKELGSAQEILAKQSFSIDRFEVSARGLLHDGGRSIELPDKESKVEAGRLTDVIIGFRPVAQPDPDLDIAVPDVRQLTESAARRVLASVGLRLEPGYGPRSLLPDSAPGQAMVQTPRAGEKAARGARVLVVFANT